MAGPRPIDLIDQPDPTVTPPAGGNVITPQSLIDDIPSADTRNYNRAQRQSSREYDESTSPGQVVRHGARTMARGVPILGRFIPPTEGSQNFENAHPWMATALNAAGGVGPMAGASRAMSLATGPGFLPNLGGQSALGAASTVGDAYASGAPPQDVSQAVVRGLLGAAPAAAGAVTSRAINPAGMPPGATTRLGNTSNVIPLPGLPVPQHINTATQQNIPQVAAGLSPTAERIGSALAGMGVGHVLGGGDVSSLLWGLTGGMGVREALRSPMGRRYTGRHADPNTNALLQGSFLQGHRFNQLPDENPVPTLGQ